MNRNPNAICKTCPYWIKGRGDLGECRRRSPILNGEDSPGDFPIVAYDDWCGEHPKFSRGEGEIRKSNWKRKSSA